MFLDEDTMDLLDPELIIEMNQMEEDYQDSLENEPQEYGVHEATLFDF